MEIREFFVQRDYPVFLIDTALSKDTQIPRSETPLDPVPSTTDTNGIPVVFTFLSF